MSQEGKILGGNYALEISTDDPVLPRTRGLSARGKGLVRMRGVRFRAKRRDAAGRKLAERLGSDALLAERLSLVGLTVTSTPAGAATFTRYVASAPTFFTFRVTVLTPARARIVTDGTLRAVGAAIGAGLLPKHSVQRRWLRRNAR